MRTVVWFSCGAASACAAKIASNRRIDVRLVYCDTLATEHPDNERFLRDVEAWTGLPVERIRSKEYATVDEVFERTRYMSGIKGARCTVEMKKVPRFEFQQPDDIHVFGLTADEGTRLRRFEANNPDLSLWWVLRDAGITKDDCYTMLRDAGIVLPAMYGLGFKNNNCLGCVKATSPDYWNKVRKHFPEVFARRVEQSRAIGVRLARYKGVRVFLDELPDIVTNEPQEDIECGPVCLGDGPQDK
jgi:hypothetical protein